jgi:hypothetical protein
MTEAFACEVEKLLFAPSGGDGGGLRSAHSRASDGGHALKLARIAADCSPKNPQADGLQKPRR